ncbi:hypothetical protein N4G70_27610 [Streptomyces sp. ASQP_92]|uniref:hypothetical protein n=1 Tax=Streptomyces sp. ASQP_92 TaxID=2979116 RepID=UPI0021BFB862|nr:hypothetical protein [Streptomyces sp. ASQP_92]MCT9092607.1 hypothetical protein [Streptomyces sp. ASQP_92]
MTTDPTLGVPSLSPYRDATASQMRLLPWTSVEGKRCYLSPGSTDSGLSRLADELEEAQTSSAEDVLAGARAVLDNPSATIDELRFALTRTREALTDILLIAESRGYRVMPPETDTGDDGPHLPASAFG